jgi:hypothetical protein
VIGARILFGAALVMLVTVVAEAAGPPATVSTSADAEVIGPSLNLTEVNPLAFGRIKSGTPGTVTVDVHIIRTATGGVALIGSGQCHTIPCDTSNNDSPNSASFWSPGVYTFTGTPGAAYRVSAPSTATAILKSGSSAPATLTVTDVVVATSTSDWNSNIGALDSAGQGSVRVGGTLQVPGGLNASSYYSYQVDVPVTVQYN